MDVIVEEKKHLEDTLDIIHIEIKKAEIELDNIIKNGKKLSGDDRKRGDHLKLNYTMSLANSKIEMYKRSIPIPYFGRIDVEFLDKKGDHGKFYIGRCGIYSGDDIIVTDWRAPISSLYYDSKQGKCSYSVPTSDEIEIVDCNLTLKRQIAIENGKLIDVQDSSFVSNDELLKPYLSVNADNKMKTIVASIQQEQNGIIRENPFSNIIIQGVAGSGKTSVALHRIAYLAYTLKDTISSDAFLVLGPNNYFLNYISSILPDLETDTVSQETLLDFTKHYINEDIHLKEDPNLEDENVKKIQAFKASLEYKEIIDQFMKKYLKNDLIPKDFQILKDVILPKDKIEKALFSSNPEYVSYERAQLLLTTYFKNNIDEIYDSVNEKYRSIYINLDLEDPKRKELIDYSNELDQVLKKDGLSLLKKYLKEIQRPILSIYQMFITELSVENCSLEEETLEILKQETLEGIKKKKVGFEDLAALMEIQFKLLHKTCDYRQIVIDEAQDYSLFHFDVLRNINPKSYFAIYGDLAQSIYSYRSIDNWEKVKETVFRDDCKIMFMNKSYRTTIEITKNANSILRLFHLNEAIPVIRHGLPVSYSPNAKDLDYKIEKIKEMKEKGYKTIAFICKTENEAKALYHSFLTKKIDTQYICDKDMEYSGGVIVLTSAAAKGLEFDGVIINDASKDVYNVHLDTDMHLLYVASTRALHELIILYNQEIVEVYQEELASFYNGH